MPQSDSKHGRTLVITDPIPFNLCFYCFKWIKEGEIIIGNGMPICTECIKACYGLLSEYYPEDLEE